jgi:uncharacterized coiled-coil protein SlyX
MTDGDVEERLTVLEQRIAELERVVKILKDTGYEGFVVLEYEEETDPYEHVPPLLEKLLKWCA